MSSTFVGRPMSPADSQVALLKPYVTRATTRGPKRDTDQHTFRLAIPPNWTAQAGCLGDMSMLDDAVGLSAGEAAKRCEGCPVIEACLADAMEREHGLSAGNRYTIRGGLSPKERAQLDVQLRECDRGHTGRWGSRASKFVCLECDAEDSAARYEAGKTDPEFMERRNRSLRASRQQRRITCVLCRSEMRASYFETHLATVHGEKAA